MVYCRTAKEIENFSNERILTLVSKMEGMTLCDFVLAVRNGKIYPLIHNNEKIDRRILCAVEDAECFLVCNGFCRPEIMSFLIQDPVTPELYFVFYYLARIMEIEDKKTFMPYLFSNDVYEKYYFCYEKVDLIFDRLGKFLDYDELDILRTEVMYMDRGKMNCIISGRIERKMEVYREGILDSMRQVFSAV